MKEEKKEDVIGNFNAENKKIENDFFLQTEEIQKATFEDIMQSIRVIQERAEDGLESEVTAYFQLYSIEKMAITAKKNIMNIAINELDNSDGSYQIGNNFVSQKNGRAIWNFSKNPKYVKLKEKLKNLEKEMKSTAGLLESQQNPYIIQDDGTIINPATGELIFSAEKTMTKKTISITQKKSK